MPRLSRSLGALTSLALAAALFAPSEASACGGGGFYQDVSSGETVSTTGHRVVISVSATQTVLWDQMQFKGAPKDFAWVYPVKADTHVEVATDGWTDALHGFTDRRVQSPPKECYAQEKSSSFNACNGCWPGAAADDGAGGGRATGTGGGDQDTGVVVKHEATIGPYDTQTISSAVPGAIAKWLTDHGYKVPADVSPILDDYAVNGFDFIAIRLSPGKGVEQMKPVRVVTPGPTTTFPMRMLQAGAANHVALDVMILSESRLKVDGFSNAEIDRGSVTWDFDHDTSDYVAQRAAALAADGGKVFLTTYARLGAVFGDAYGDTDSVAAYYSEAVFSSGEGEACNIEVLDKLADNPEGGYQVVDVCNDQGTCGQPGANEIDSRDLSCGDATDLAIAMIGMHPRDVWITRFEANLPRTALTKDLVVVPVQDEVEVPGVLVAGKSVGDPCRNVEVAAPVFASNRAPKPPVQPGSLGLIGAGLVLALAMLRRRFAG